MTDLKPCPFCGGVAESDSRRAYRALAGGQLGNACAVYCTACEADISVCLEDVPEWSTEEALQYVTERWNTRPREAELEAEIAELRALITDPRTVTMTRARYEEYQAAEERLAAYEGQLTAEEMRERCAVIARAERHNREGSKSFFERGAISMSVHVEDAIRALPTKREEG